MMIASMAFFAIEDLFLKFLGPVMPPHQILFLWAMAVRWPLRFGHWPSARLVHRTNLGSFGFDPHCL